MLYLVRSVFLDIRRVGRYVCFWPLWCSKFTILSTVITFSSVHVCFSLPVSCRWSVLHVSQISVTNIPALSLLQLIFKNSASIIQKLYFLNQYKFLIRAFVSTAKWHITSPVCLQCITTISSAFVYKHQKCV